MTSRFSRRDFAVGATLGAMAAGASALEAEAAATPTADYDAFAVPAGSKQFTYVNVVRNDAVSVDVPVGVVNGREEGPTVAVTGGIFSTEFCGIEAASRLYRDLDPRRTAGRVLIVPVVNMPGFQFRTPAFNLSSGNNPIDGKSVNTMFPGDPNGTVSQVIAHFVFDKLVSRANYFIDLRGGDLPEDHLVHTMFAVAGSEQVQQVSRDMALACGFDYHQARGQRPGSLWWEACSAGIPSIITQSGLGYKTQPEEELIENHVRGVTNVMKNYGMLAGSPNVAERQRELSSEFVVIKATESGVFHATGTPGDRMRRGDAIGKVTNLDGSVGEEIRTERGGVLHTYFVRRVVMKGDTVAYVVPFA
ncbi:MAG: succinylglutamate desuccinylase/aspartoacylase family protein [Pseudomonadota bacterium]